MTDPGMTDIVTRLRIRRSPLLDGEREEAADEIERLQSEIDTLDVLNELLLEKIERLRVSLEESVSLQSHYAVLLNNYDGGKRMHFVDADAWVRRIDYLVEKAP